MIKKIALSVAIGALVLTLVPVALAGKGTGGKGKPGGGGTVGGGTLSLVLLNSTDGLPHFGQNVTFNVTSSSAYPMVNLTCYQNGDWVTNQSVGFYAGWPWSRNFPLSSWKWTGGAADCTARLYDNTTNATLATLTFRANA